MSLNDLCLEYRELSEERTALEERISLIRSAIFAEVGDGGEVSVPDFRVKCLRVERSVFNRAKLDDLFGTHFFEKVSKPSYADMVYLTKRKEIGCGDSTGVSGS